MVTKGDAEDYKEFTVAILLYLMAWRSPRCEIVGGVIADSIMLVITSVQE